MAAFAAASLLVELTPGPNMTWLALVAVTDGRRAGFAAVAGVALGLAGLGLCAALGLATLVTAVPAVYQVLRWAGVAYLLWLALEAWRGVAGAEAPLPVGLPAQFGRGLLTNLLNPKAAVFYMTALPPFLPPSPAFAQVLTFTAVYVAVATLVHGGIVALAGSFTRFLGPPGRERLVRRGMAVALVGVALWVWWKT